MIAVTIGRTFLKAYNEKYETDYSAKEFFEKEYFECFFNHTKYMQCIFNSSFDQAYKQSNKGKMLTPSMIKDALNKLHSDISEGRQDGSVAIGFPALDIDQFATTSGLITDMNIGINKEDIYLSWIGGGLGIGVKVVWLH